MDDSMEFMTLQHDCLLSQLTASAERNTTLLGPLDTRRTGGAIAVPIDCKPSAVFVDADAFSSSPPLASSYEQRQLYAQYDEYDNNNVCMQQMYFETPTKDTSLSPSASYASFDDHTQVFAEFFETPLNEVQVESVVKPEMFKMEGLTDVADYLEIPAPVVDPNLGAILHEIRSEAAQIDQRSRDGGSQFSGSAETITSDDEFEAALSGDRMEYSSTLIGHEDNQSSDDDDHEMTIKPKRKYSKRLGRPLTKDERRERKKAQNRAAAIRYRQKKMDSQCTNEQTLHKLAKKNQALKSTIKTTQAEIDIMKRLLNDVRSAM